MPSAQEENSIVTSSSSGGDNYLKYAIIALVVISAIVLAEGTYLYFTQQEPQTPLQEEVSEIRQRQRQTPTPSPHPASAKTRSSIDISEIESFAENLRRYNPPGFFISANINWTAAGRVQETNTNQTVDAIGGENYSSVSILNDNGERMTAYLSPTEKNSARFILKGPGGSREVGFEDIRPGDYVIINVTQNLLDSTENGIVVFEIERDQIPTN